MDIASLLIRLEAQPMPAPILHFSVNTGTSTVALVMNRIDANDRHLNYIDFNNGVTVAHPMSRFQELVAIEQDAPIVEAVSHPVALVARVNSPVIASQVQISDDNVDATDVVQARRIQ